MAAKDIQTSGVNKGWYTAEKIVAILIALWGIFTTYNLASAVSDQVYINFTRHITTSYLEIIKNSHLGIILSFLSIFGGFLLYFNDREGWLMCIPSTAMFAVNFFIAARSNSIDTALIYGRYYKSYGITALILIAVTIFLLQKPVWKKYKPTLKTWFWVGGIMLAFIIDKIIF